MEASPFNNTFLISIILFFVALAGRAVFAFLETSITALRLFKIKELARTTGRYKRLFQALEKYPHRVLITILIANSFTDVMSAAMATHIMETVFGYFNLSSGLGFSAGIAIATLAILIFGEILPKNIAKNRSDWLFRSTLWLINGVYFLFHPLVSFLLQFSDFIMTKLGSKKRLERKSEWVSSEREIRFLIEYVSERGIIEEEKTEMLQNIFELGDTPVREIMVPATDIVSININSTVNDIRRMFIEHYFTRLPVYENTFDNIIGMVYLKDIFALQANQETKPLRDLIRPILFAPESMKVNQLLREFRRQHMHIAIVLNEHGSVTGLITLEDVLEEIVGEISDEHEPATAKILPLKQGGWLVDASIPLEELEDFFNFEFKTENSTTLGGFLTEQLQHLPKKGERILYKNLYFQVQKASPKRVLQVLIFENKTGNTNSQE